MTDPQFTALPSQLRWVAPPAPYDPRKPAWASEGACLGADPDIFFPHRGADSKPAKAICAGCNVRPQSLDYTLTNAEKHGVWGGLSERERRKLRGERRRQAPRPADPQRQQAQRMAGRGAPIATIAAALGITTRTVHRYLEEAS
jgi:WhiB family redox-sensing transcriptional regulator